MKVRLTQDVSRVDDILLKQGAEFDVVVSSKIGPPIGDKPGFLTIETGDGELVIFAQEFEIIDCVRE